MGPVPSDHMEPEWDPRSASSGPAERRGNHEEPAAKVITQLIPGRDVPCHLAV